MRWEGKVFYDTHMVERYWAPSYMHGCAASMARHGIGGLVVLLVDEPYESADTTARVIHRSIHVGLLSLGPFVIMIIAYSLIASRFIQQWSNSKQKSNTQASRIARQIRERELLICFALSSCLYMICWAPETIQQTYEMIIGQLDLGVNPDSIPYALVYKFRGAIRDLYTAVNPLVFIIANNNFRRPISSLVQKLRGHE